MENDFKNLAKQLNQNFNALLTTVDKAIAKIPEEKRNETMANSQTIAEIKKADIWEDKAIDILFPYVSYIPKEDKNYSNEVKKQNHMDCWQRSVNLYGVAGIYPVMGVNKLFEPTANYSKITSEAIKELKQLNLITAINCGYNTYLYILNTQTN